VLAALAGGEPMTAGQLADRVGVSRAAVSSTLSRLAKTGEVQKADRGYRLTPPSPPVQPTDTPAAAAGGAALPTAAADAASPAAPATTAADG
jgi:DNA-binding GntR family transcriptional regulator